MSTPSSGPPRRSNTLGTLTATVDAGVLTCSPTATALALDDFPDDGLLLPHHSQRLAAGSRHRQ
jgi:hypothetical protein